VVILIGDNIPEMLFVALGTQSIGAISAAIYQTTMPEEIAQLLDYLKATVVFCDDQEQVDKIVEIRDRVPGVRKVIYEDPRGMRSYRADDWFMFIEGSLLLGRKQPMRKTRTASNHWWIRDRPTMSATSA
jgi:long-chain acyl-CoA synthetase